MSMKNLNSRQLKLRRNLILIGGTLINLVIWFFLPDTIRNSALIHVGNGSYGTKYGLLLLNVFPFFCFFERPKLPEHTDDPDVRAELAEEALVRCYRKQYGLAAAEELVVILVLLGSLLL